MSKVIKKITELSIKELKAAYIIVGTLFLMLVVNIMIVIIMNDTGNSLTNISDMDVFISIVPISAIFLSTQKFKLTYNLGAKKMDILNSHFLILGIFSFISAIVPLIYFKLIDSVFINSALAKRLNIHLFSLFENNVAFSDKGLILGLISWALFIFVWGSIVYFLFLLFFKKFGSIVWIILIIFFSIFVPIFHQARVILREFIYIIMLQPNAYFNIMCSIIIIAIFYYLSKFSFLVGKNRNE